VVFVCPLGGVGNLVREGSRGEDLGEQGIGIERDSRNQLVGVVLAYRKEALARPGDLVCQRRSRPRKERSE
jgi:hypothetical protein